MKSKIALHCIAPDGDLVTEGTFPDEETAWERVNDMGSRWFFYPVPILTSSSPAKVIRDVPEGMPREWIGKRLARFLKALKADPQHAADYCNGETPFCIYP